MKVEEQLKKMKWKEWLERPFDVFVLSIFNDGIKKEYFEKIGLINVKCKAILYQGGRWYQSDEIWREMEQGIKKYLEQHDIFELTKNFNKYFQDSKNQINILIKKSINPIEKLKYVYEILTTVITYVYLSHGLEYIYEKKLSSVVPKYIKKDINKFIGDASYPKKKQYTH